MNRFSESNSNNRIPTTEYHWICSLDFLRTAHLEYVGNNRKILRFDRRSNGSTKSNVWLFIWVVYNLQYWFWLKISLDYVRFQVGLYQKGSNQIISNFVTDFCQILAKSSTRYQHTWQSFSQTLERPFIKHLKKTIELTLLKHNSHFLELVLITFPNISYKKRTDYLEFKWNSIFTLPVGFYKCLVWHSRRGGNQNILLSILWNFLQVERNRTWKHARNQKEE